jgi:hypothetical protein
MSTKPLQSQTQSTCAKTSSKVERKIAELLRLHGLRQGRYFGSEKTDQQAAITATMVNAKRLFTLAAEDPEVVGKPLRQALAA